MAKKLKFPLVLRNDYQARTLEEVHEYWDLGKMISYYQNGKLLLWLQDRSYENEVSQLLKLKETDSDFICRLHYIFGVEYIERSEVDFDNLVMQQEKLNLLKQYTTDTEVLSHIDQVAINQEELADLLNDGCNIIYLCNAAFHIPLSQENKTYIHVGGASIANFDVIKNSYEVKGIEFVNFAESRKDYSAIISQVDVIKEKWNSTVINYKHTNLASSYDYKRLAVNSGSFYDTIVYGNSTQEHALEAAHRATLEAYSMWQDLFMPSGYSSIYTKCIKSYIDQEWNCFLKALNDETAKVYNDLTELLSVSDDSKLRNMITIVQTSLGNIIQELANYRENKSTLNKQIFNKLNEILLEYKSDNEGCECSVRVEKSLYIANGKSKKLYGITRSTGIKHLESYVNKRLDQLAPDIEDMVLQEHKFIMEYLNEKVHDLLLYIKEQLV